MLKLILNKLLITFRETHQSSKTELAKNLKIDFVETTTMPLLASSISPSTEYFNNENNFKNFKILTDTSKTENNTSNDNSIDILRNSKRHLRSASTKSNLILSTSSNDFNNNQQNVVSHQNRLAHYPLHHHRRRRKGR